MHKCGCVHAGVCRHVHMHVCGVESGPSPPPREWGGKREATTHDVSGGEGRIWPGLEGHLPCSEEGMSWSTQTSLPAAGLGASGFLGPCNPECQE